MEIKIYIDDDENIVIIDNERLNNDSFVNLSIGDTTELVPLTELFLAVKTFYDLRQANRDADDFYKRQD